MDGIHDMGGMHGFGTVDPEPDEPVFHHDWEKRSFALVMAAGFVTLYGDDQFRRQIERIDPREYLSSSYYELWLEGLIGQLKEFDVVDEDELAAGRARKPLPERFDTADQAMAQGLSDVVWAGASQAMPQAQGFPHRFKVGDLVLTNANMPYGHTRLPRYARDKVGTVVAENGAFVFADSNSERFEPEPQMLYTVEFTARELWGDDALEGDSLCLDLWDAYLNPPPVRS